MKGCKNCPAYAKCTITYRGSACAALRGTYGLDNDPEIITNADIIRSMGDEELAEFLILSPEMEFDVCRFCTYGNTSGDDRGICLTDDGICRAEANCAAFKKWLQQPAEEDT